jgi:hypothetical protein
MPNNSRTYVFKDVTLRDGGVRIFCNEIRWTREAEDQFTAETDNQNNDVDSYNFNLQGTLEADVGMAEEASLTFLQQRAEAVDAAALTGGSIAAASPPTQISLVEPASGSILASAIGRLRGHGSGVQFDASGQKSITFRWRLTNCTQRIRGYAQVV